MRPQEGIGDDSPATRPTVDMAVLRRMLPLTAVWLMLLGPGFTVLLLYASQYAPTIPPPPSWPLTSLIPAPKNRPALLVFCHPHCPCTRATLAELSRLMGRCGDKLDAYVLFDRPAHATADWDRSSLREQGESIPGVTVLTDFGGDQGLLFNVRTSGEVLLYDSRGQLVFHGGITPARGHEGYSAGRKKIEEFTTMGGPDRVTTPVFGCPLRNENVTPQESTTRCRTAS